MAKIHNEVSNRVHFFMKLKVIILKISFKKLKVEKFNG